MGSAAVVTEISKPSPSGLLRLGSHLHLGELKWGWAGVSSEILQPIRKRKGKKKKKRGDSGQESGQCFKKKYILLWLSHVFMPLGNLRTR